MKLELLNKGSNTVGASRNKAALASAKKNIWRGKFDRRKRPRDEDMLIELALTPAHGMNDRK